MEDFELLFNDLLVIMQRDRGSVRGSAAANNRHAQHDAVGRAVSAKVVQEAFCEEGVNVQDHNAALFKQYVDEYAPDGMQMQHPRADTVNIDWRRLPWESASITPINTGIWEGAVNAVFRPDFVFPLSIVQGRLVTCTWTEAVSANTAGMGRRAARDGRC
mmetsp:Transcript_45539/g.113948  ORF Transcript_45539/g.113948 Transcript_45539/m.113948 type:complete len:160 (+) Transcript_45539:3764-4243(+)